MSRQQALKVNEWNPEATKVNTVPNKNNGVGIKKYRLTSEQLNTTLQIQTPKMHTWGIQEFVDKKTGQGDGKFKLSMNFPMESNPETDMFKEKLERFYETVITAIETNSTSFYGKKRSGDVIKETSYPILKYPKIKESLELDYSKPPSISIKVENKYDQERKSYGDELDVKIYNKSSQLIYPNEDPNDVPMNYVTKSSTVVAIIKCSSIWIGPSNWGITFSAVQIIVVNQGDSISTSVCQIRIDDDDEEDVPVPASTATVVKSVQKPIVTSTFNIPEKKETFIEDDDEDVPPIPQAPIVQVQPVPVAKGDDDSDDSDDDEEPVAKPVEPVAPVKRVVKKIVKK